LALCAKAGVTAVYAYEDGAAFSFQEAKRVGLQCLYDLPIGYWRTAHRLLETEKHRWPEWSSTLTGFADSEDKLNKKDEELRMADRIFVASTFTASTLKDFPGVLAPIEVIPYGFPPVAPDRDYSVRRCNQPLKLLFVGSLSQRKGIADVFDVVDALRHHVELTVVGNKVSNHCTVLDTFLSKHRWFPSLPYPEILKLMRSHDVLVFPSLFEGFGLVITEAMSQGTPVITTERTAGPDFIQDGENGWIIKAGSTGELKLGIEKILLNKDLIRKTGAAASETARHRPWPVYGTEFAAAVNNHMQVWRSVARV
jgi:glycosyltransferase involved in cell wall biosynthesis